MKEMKNPPEEMPSKDGLLFDLVTITYSASSVDEMALTLLVAVLLL